MLRLTTASLFLVAPAAAQACDLDGLFGYHRYNPFGNQPQQASAAGREIPQPPPPPEPADRPTSETEQQQARADRATEQAPDTDQDEPRKWETPGSDPVSAEDLATFH